MKSSKALRLVKPLIENNTQRFICNALKSVGGTKTAVYKALRNICGNKSIDHWLWQKSVDFKQFTRTSSLSDYQNQLRLYRLRWIDWMVKGYEKVGD